MSAMTAWEGGFLCGIGAVLLSAFVCSVTYSMNEYPFGVHRALTTSCRLPAAYQTIGYRFDAHIDLPLDLYTKIANVFAELREGDWLAQPKAPDGIFVMPSANERFLAKSFSVLSAQAVSHCLAIEARIRDPCTKVTFSFVSTFCLLTTAVDEMCDKKRASAKDLDYNTNTELEKSRLYDLCRKSLAHQHKI